MWSDKNYREKTMTTNTKRIFRGLEGCSLTHYELYGQPKVIILNNIHSRDSKLIEDILGDQYCAFCKFIGDHNGDCLFVIEVESFLSKTKVVE